MVHEKVTRKDLREMHIGQTRIFQLADPKKVASARVTVQQLRHEENLRFDVKPDYESISICITRTL